ncbi:methyl-accepting chemotaxis protein [Pseudooceanicola sp. HF7]|uniref:methyl-accepting chemotaxis protein n=1 Tax=Pseudooceanicola sp. HF7 TaxID=2721560 RepID=UPI001431DBAF|nr:methyl-accepting chemotaxis protein [Pseudooceanicola sp. HF7]NIZ10126.1 PAS domain-containing protein [Pseudooceanicola sp. HF7]
MPRSARDSRAIPFFRSTFFRATFIVALCILSVVTTTELIAMSKARQSIVEWTAIRGNEATAGLSGQVGGALKFNRPEAVDELIEGFAGGVGGDLRGAMSVRADGSTLTELQIQDFDVVAARRAAEAAIRTQSPQVDMENLIWAYPARYGPAKEITGAFVTQWDVRERMAAALAGRINAIFMAFGVFLVAVGIAAVLFYRSISVPLRHVTDQMGDVAKGRFDAVIHGTRRADEIGGIAKRLDEFRLDLQAARATEMENAFKSEALRTSGAAMILLDDKMDIAFVNGASRKLLEHLKEVIRGDWTDFDPKDLQGQPMKRFPGVDAFFEEVSSGRAALPRQTELKWGEARILVSVDSVSAEDKHVLGYVIELQDVTKQKLNEAVLAAIDTQQVRVEFDENFNLAGWNRRLAEMAGPSVETMRGLRRSKVLTQVGETEEEAKAAFVELRKGLSLTGKFVLQAGGDQELFFQGSLTPIMDPDGTVERCVFVGSDITESHLAMEAADRERKETAAQQQLVMNSLKVGLRSLAQGDLTSTITQPFRADYEQLRANFNQAVEELHGAMCAVVQNTESIQGETREISNAADDLAQRTEKQAATLEETAAALDELTASVKSAASGADEASQIAAGAQAKAETGGTVARQAVEAMDAIRASSQEISKITSVIDDIAFQTNLLALNAGVEAARAGDAGRGFAVVATEVRALAQRSSEAAREINALISASGNHVKSGVDLVDRTGEALGDIVTSVVDISNRVSAIATSAREQSMGLNEINTAMNDLDQVTQQNAAMFEETTAASHSLTSEANSLVEAASKFKVNAPRGSKSRKRTAGGPGREKVADLVAVGGGAAPAGKTAQKWKET